MIRTRGVGSGILIDEDGKQFFVTAKHMFQAPEAPDRLCTPSHLDIHMRGRWIRFPVVRFGTAETDLAVIDFDWNAPMHPVAIGADRTILGQDLVILGFPDGHHSEIEGDTVPMAGRATLSRVPTNTHDHFLIQCNAFHGFSGGPVVYMSNLLLPKVVGIISRYLEGKTPMQYAKGHPVPTGFVQCVKIDEALDVINNRMLAVA